MSSISQQEDAIVRLTETAAREIKDMLAKEENSVGKGLRVFIEQGGCSGLQYGMVFDEKREGDHEAEFHGVPVRVDNISAEYIKGAIVDYSDSLTGGGFKISNPRAKTSCGCGKSFEA
jgi:iron-sulfur cluster assembly protein